MKNKHLTIDGKYYQRINKTRAKNLLASRVDIFTNQGIAHTPFIVPVCNMTDFNYYENPDTNKCKGIKKENVYYYEQIEPILPEQEYVFPS